MDFILYKTQDADNIMGKLLEEPLTLDILLRSDTDINDPVIVLSKVEGVDFTDYNYCYIPELERYYFIRDYNLVSAQLTNLSLECDYLETYKDKILTSQGSYRRVMRAGDFGEVNLSTTGREIIVEHFSDVELEPSSDAILSVLNGEKVTS